MQAIIDYVKQNRYRNVYSTNIYFGSNWFKSYQFQSVFINLYPF